MRASRFTIQGEDCYYEITDFINREIKVSYTSDVTNGILFFAEDFSLMNSSDLMIVLKLQKLKDKDDQCEIEIITGGGGQGVFSWTFGNEKRRLNKFNDLLYEFCGRKRYKVSDLIVLK